MHCLGLCTQGMGRPGWRRKMASPPHARLGKLLDGGLARVEAGGDLADGREHSDAAIVELLGAHLVI
eukprot:UN5164